MKRARRNGHLAWPHLLLPLALPWLTVAHAHAQFPTDDFSALTLDPTPGAHALVAAERAEVWASRLPVLSLWLDHGAHMLTVDTQCESRAEIDCGVVGSRVQLARRQTVFHALASQTLLPHLALRVAIPVALSDGEGLPFATAEGPDDSIQGGTQAGLADVRAGVKASLPLDEIAFLNLGMSGWVYIPTGHATAEGRHIGDEGVGGSVLVNGDVRFGPVRAMANVGFRYRPEASFLSTSVGSTVIVRGGGVVDMGAGLSALAELDANLAVTGGESGVQTHFAARMAVHPLDVGLGGGVGIVRGAGVPDYRLLATVRWAPVLAGDSDGDGLDDDVDRCPNAMEDFDGFEDQDGCPEPDNDQDGIRDQKDRCPNEPEDRDTYQDEDGCRDPDNDGDGIEDGYDSCPLDAEDINGHIDDDGCPEHDDDADGVSNEDDQCPQQPEDTDGFADLDGCPEEDVDGDGVLDVDDMCPEEPGKSTRNPANNGCP